MEAPAKRHELQVVSQDDSPPTRFTRDGDQARLALSWLDKLGAGAFADGDKQELLDLVRDSAESLTGPDRNDARLRLLSRAIASMRAQQSLLEGAMGERLAARDYDGVAMLDRVLAGVVKRLVLLLAEHRHHCATDRRTALVAVGSADNLVIKVSE